MRYASNIALGILVFAVLLMSGKLFAAEFPSGGIDNQGCERLRDESHCITLAFIGEIRTGDLQRLEARIRAIEAPLSGTTKMRVGKLHLNSPGGNIHEAMKIGRMVRGRQIGTVVTSDSSCASACVLLLAAGVHRFSFGKVLIHSFYSPAMLGSGDYDKTSKMLDKVANEVEAYLKEMRIPRNLLDAMLQVPHTTVHDLSDQELFAFGLIGVDPAYIQSKALKVN